MRLLQAEGLLEHQPDRGVVVRTNVSELNARRHRAIYDASGSSYLNDFIARLWLALPVRAIWLTRRAAHSVAQHGEIMAAIDARESGRAAELMREHVAFGAVTTGQHLRAIESAN